MKFFVKSKKPDLAKNLDFDSFKADFVNLGAKKVFTYLKKAFIKTLLLHHLEPKHYIYIETNVLGYAISGILHQLTSNQYFFNHVTHKYLNSPKSKIS